MLKKTATNVQQCSQPAIITQYNQCIKDKNQPDFLIKTFSWFIDLIKKKYAQDSLNRIELHVTFYWVEKNFRFNMIDILLK